MAIHSVSTSLSAFVPSRSPVKPLFVLGALVLASLCGGADAHAGKPLPARAWWAGLDHVADRVPAHGVTVLRPPASGRVRVPGGSFVMGSTRDDLERAMELCRTEIFEALCAQARGLFLTEAHAHEVTISSFELDRTEVTVSEYSRCVAAEACQPPGFTPGDPRFDRPNLPVTAVRWEDASAYCTWSGGRLPTEAEWEFAARGPANRRFPWGDVYNPHLANHGAYANDLTDASDGFVGLAPVGSFPDGATPLGVLDMAGNVAEYVEDFFDLSDEEGFGYPAASQANPKGPTSGVYHTQRGGSYLSGAVWIRSAARGVRGMGGATEGVLERSPSTGFRCAADTT